MVQNTGYDHLVQFCKICFLIYIFYELAALFCKPLCMFLYTLSKTVTSFKLFLFLWLLTLLFPLLISGISISVKLFLFSFLLVFEGVFSNEDDYYSELHIFQWICYLWVHVLPCRLCALVGRVYWCFSTNIKPYFVPVTTLLSTREKQNKIKKIEKTGNI